MPVKLRRPAATSLRREPVALRLRHLDRIPLRLALRLLPAGWPLDVRPSECEIDVQDGIVRRLDDLCRLAEQVVGGGEVSTTHNRMEPTAICEALETLTGVIEVDTDSTYVERCFNQNWHERWLRDGSWRGSNGPVKNRDLWERMFGLVWVERREVTFVWIRGHAGDPNNHRVDQLARAAALAAA